MKEYQARRDSVQTAIGNPKYAPTGNIFKDPTRAYYNSTTNTIHLSPDGLNLAFGSDDGSDDGSTGYARYSQAHEQGHAYQFTQENTRTKLLRGLERLVGMYTLRGYDSYRYNLP